MAKQKVTADNIGQRCEVWYSDTDEKDKGIYCGTWNNGAMRHPIVIDQKTRKSLRVDSLTQLHNFEPRYFF